MTLKTPYKQKAAASGKYLSGSLKQSRIILNELGKSIPEATTDLFNQHVVCYDVMVHDIGDGNKKVYRTSGIVSDIGSIRFQGRGTRVFRGRALDDTVVFGDEAAIKDVWVDEDRQREGEIRQLLSDNAPCDDKDLFKKQVLARGDAQIRGRVDHAQNRLMNGQVVPTTNMFNYHRATLLPPKRSQLNSGSGGTAPCDKTHHPTAPPPTNHQYPPEVRYKIDSKEVGVPLHSLVSLADVFRALADATIALRLASNQSQVHRDVSSGNILMYKGVGKLVDLEYMKVMGTESGHDVRTGTLDYMAVEVERGHFFLHPTPAIQLQNVLQVQPLVKTTVFYHNPLHDLESVWWIGVWTLLCRDIDPEHGMCEERVTKQPLFGHPFRTNLLNYNPHMLSTF